MVLKQRFCGDGVGITKAIEQAVFLGLICAAISLVSSRSSGQSLSPAMTYGSGGQNADSVAAADLNGDGSLDLVVANYCGSGIACGNGNGTVGVLLGNGDGTFQTAVAYNSGGYYASSVAVGDFNGDGKPDLVVAIPSDNSYSGLVGVLLGNGDGTFQTAVTYASGGSWAYSVALADLNGDGKPDLAVTNLFPTSNNAATSTVGVLLGNGDGTFQAAVTYGSGGYGAYMLAVGDVNGDVNPDLLVVNECGSNSSCTTDGTVAVLLGNGDGTFQSAATFDAGGQDSQSVAIGDLNGDSKADLVVSNYCALSGGRICIGDGTVGVLLGNGDGTFQAAVTYDSGGWNAWPVALSDVNGDGMPDLLVLNECGSSSGCTTDGTVGVLLGNGDGTFQAASAFDVGGLRSVSLSAADVNGDGKPDLVVANGCIDNTCASSSLSVLINASVGTATSTLRSSQNPSKVRHPVTFMVKVASRGFKSTPTGTVTFLDGSTVMSREPLNASGIATYSTSVLAEGRHSIRGFYSGDATYAKSTSAVSIQTVSRLEHRHRR